MGLTTVHRGPLFYAHDTLAHLHSIGDALPSFLDGPDPRYAIAPSTLHPSAVHVRRQWSPTGPPTRRAIAVAACRVGWKLWPPEPPVHIERGEAACIHVVANITLMADAVSSDLLVRAWSGERSD